MHIAPQLHTHKVSGIARVIQPYATLEMANWRQAFMIFLIERRAQANKAKTRLQASTRAVSLGRRPSREIIVEEPSNSTSLATTPGNVATATAFALFSKRVREVDHALHAWNLSWIDQARDDAKDGSSRKIR